MRLQLRLWHKGLVLVALPVFFELVFVSILGWQLALVDGELAHAERQREIAIQLKGLARSYYEAGAALFAATAAGEKLPVQKHFFDQQYVRLKSEIPQRFETLKQLTITSPADRQSVIRLEQTGDKVCTLLDEIHRAGKFSRLAAQSDKLDRLAKQTFEELNDELQSIDRQEARLANDRLYTQLQWHLTIRRFTIAGLLATALLALSLSLFYSHSISRRLAVLVDNTNRLSSSKPLLPPLEGSDEIAHLDAVFHTMANSLREAMRKERTIFDNTIDVILTIDAQGTILSISKGCLRAWGFDSQELVGSNIAQLLVEDDRPKTLRSLENTRDVSLSSTFEAGLLAADGRTVHILWSAHWSQEENNFFCVAHDMSDRHAAEQFKQQLISMVSHDLRTPLSSIGCSLTLVSEGVLGEISHSAKDELDRASDNITHLTRLVNDLLDLERMEAGRLDLLLAEVTIDVLLKRSVSAIKAYAADNGISIQATDCDAVVVCDRDRMVQVIVNLLSNAVKFSARGSSVNLQCRLEPEWVVVSIADSGRGIPSSMLTTIFDRYKQVDVTDNRERGGMGLGLPICQSIVEAHGGKIWASSDGSNGSVFCFTVRRAIICDDDYDDNHQAITTDAVTDTRC